MRIVGGKFKGRSLVSPQKGDYSIRPTTDRCRESLFNILAHGKWEGKPPIDFKTCRVLDLFAGTGALGLEALSRGAPYCIFIDQSVEARGIIRQNIENLGLTGQCKLWRRNAEKLGRCAPSAPFDLVLQTRLMEQG